MPMIDSVSGLAQVAVALQQSKLSDEVNTAVLKKVQDIQEQQGAAAIQLLQSANVTQRVDIRV
jgi:hypothetical protein